MQIYNISANRPKPLLYLQIVSTDNHFQKINPLFILLYRI